MELIDAMKVVNLMKERSCLLDMRETCDSNSRSGWSFMVNDRKFPIPTETKKMFTEAINKALEYYNSELEKI